MQRSVFFSSFYLRREYLLSKTVLVFLGPVEQTQAKETVQSEEEQNNGLLNKIKRAIFG